MRNRKVRALAALSLAGVMAIGYLAYNSNSARAQDAQTAGAKTGDKPGDKKGNMPGGMGQMSPEDQKKMMEAYMKAASPGPEHKKLAETAGDWQANVTMYEGPQPTKSTGRLSPRMRTSIEKMKRFRYAKKRWYPGSSSMYFHE